MKWFTACMSRLPGQGSGTPFRGMLVQPSAAPPAHHTAFESPPEPCTAACTHGIRSIAPALLAGPGNFIAHVYYSFLFPQYILCDACLVKNGSFPVFSMELLQNLLLAEGRGFPVCGEDAYLCGRSLGKERLRADRGGRLRALGGHSPVRFGS